VSARHDSKPLALSGSANLSNGALLTAEQAAPLLAVKSKWLLAEARAGRIPHVRLGPKYVRFEAVELEAWWQARRHGPHVTGSIPVSNGGDPQ
jgi:excisionase family DNA binding protein